MSGLWLPAAPLLAATVGFLLVRRGRRTAAVTGVVGAAFGPVFGLTTGAGLTEPAQPASAAINVRAARREARRAKHQRGTGGLGQGGGCGART